MKTYLVSPSRKLIPNQIPTIDGRHYMADAGHMRLEPTSTLSHDWKWIQEGFCQPLCICQDLKPWHVHSWDTCQWHVCGCKLTGRSEKVKGWSEEIFWPSRPWQGPLPAWHHGHSRLFGMNHKPVSEMLHWKNHQATQPQRCSPCQYPTGPKCHPINAGFYRLRLGRQCWQSLVSFRLCLLTWTWGHLMEL